MSSETSRVGKLAADKSITPAKKEAFQVKLNVLSSFAAAATAVKAEL